MSVSFHGLPAALHVPGPARGHEVELSLFGQFVGSWELAWTGTDEHGRRAEARGELHFGWVLGGRAIQDTWIVPGPSHEGHGDAALAFHGSTIRFYDPTIKAWRSTWVEPINGRVRRFIGRPTPWGIELLSDEDDPQLRWTFSEITSTSFTWTAHRSVDGGSSWDDDERMAAQRVSVA